MMGIKEGWEVPFSVGALWALGCQWPISAAAEQTEAVFSSETQANGAITAIFHRAWRTWLHECPSCKCGKCSAILSSMAPSWRIGNVPIKIPPISWFFTGYWYQWSASGILPCPKQLFCTWFYGKLWNEIFSRFLGGWVWDLKNLKQLCEALLLSENHTFWKNSLLEI